MRQRRHKSGDLDREALLRELAVERPQLDRVGADGRHLGIRGDCHTTAARRVAAARQIMLWLLAIGLPVVLTMFFKLLFS